MESLTRVALAGTSRTTGLAFAEHPTDATISSVAGRSVEQQLLLKAAARSLYHQAGYQAWPEVAPLEAAPNEVLRPVSRKLNDLLQHVLSGNADSLVDEFLPALAARQLLIPPELLPQALNVKTPRIRELLLPLLGERGRWLARLNPEWAWVSEGVALQSGQDLARLQHLWDEGTFAIRSEALSVVRAASPETARRWLQASFASDKAEHRARLLQVLTLGLSPADEPFLETCLADRSASVVQTAAELLCSLPSSALVQRMQARAEAMLTFVDSQLVCQPPETLDKTWERDGIAKSSGGGSGPRAGWTRTVFSAVPPQHWCLHFQQTPAELLAAIAADPFADAIFEGWTTAAIRHSSSSFRSDDWVRTLWTLWSQFPRSAAPERRQAQIQSLTQLLAAMPAADAEEAWLNLCAQGAPADCLTMLGTLAKPWSSAFSRALLTQLRERLRHFSANLAWLPALADAGRAIPAETFSDALTPWESDDPAALPATRDDFEREVGRFQELVRTRQRFLQELRPDDTP